MFSTRSSGFLLLVLVLIGGCENSPRIQDGAQVGHDLGAVGPQDEDFHFASPVEGQIIYLGFPQMRNESDKTVRILESRLEGVSKNIQVARYLAHSTKQFSGESIYGYDPRHPVDGLDFKGARLLPVTYRVEPHKTSRRFVMAEIRLVKYPPKGAVTQCGVKYEETGSGRIFEQEFPCNFFFGP